MNTATVDIRKAELRDADAIAEVHRDAWQNAYAGIIPYRALAAMINRRGGRWWENAIRRSATVLVIEVGGKIAGYATIGRNRARELKQEGEIYELYLRPECQGIGLGSRLFSAARERLSAHGLRGMVVWALEENVNAVSFYASSGGRDIAEGVEVFDQKAVRKVAFIWD
jgi:ribosomal protein S18 acetylase RimI-like enzyme